MLLQRCCVCRVLPSRVVSPKRCLSIVTENLKNAPPKPRESVKTLPHKNTAYEDAYKIAEKALGLLRRDDHEGVMRLIRQNHDLDLTVTWNYLIRHQIDQGKLNAALTDFQKMKKRQHFPNSHTYTILFDGMARHHEKVSREKLEKMVDSLLDDRRIEPTLIHLNAVLQFCSKSGHLNLAYELLERFRNRAVESLDARTYNTLFLMLRHAIEDNTIERKTLNEEARQFMTDARNIWKDVETLWLAGRLIVDARLLATYTNLLMKGSVEDAFEGLATIAQFCDLPDYPIENRKKKSKKEKMQSERKVIRSLKKAHKSLDRSLKLEGPNSAAVHEQRDFVERKTASVEELLAARAKETPATTTAAKPQSRRRGARIDLDTHLFNNLLFLAEKTEDRGLLEHYWQNARASVRGPLERSTYEARLRTLMDASVPELAVEILEEMRLANVQLESKTIFLALQCHFTRKQSDLKRSFDFLMKYAHPESHAELLQSPIITSVARLMRTCLDTVAQTQTILELLTKLEWKNLARQTEGYPHQEKRFRECIAFLRKKCQTLIDKGHDKQSLQKFSNMLEGIQREYFPEDLETTIQKSSTPFRRNLSRV